MQAEDAGAILAREDTLVVYRAAESGPEVFVVVDADGVTGFNGHVDLGTGIGTALAQIVAEELDVAFSDTRIVLGSLAAGPNQGGTIASVTLQVTAVPLRKAAAQARAALVALAAEALAADPAQLVVENGTVGLPGPENRFIRYAELLKGRRVHLVLDEQVPVKSVADYRVVGQPVPRKDIAAKASGSFTYVHDVRVPGMLHGRVVRPPYAGVAQGPFVGNSLLAVDEASVAGLPGVVGVVVIRDFVGVVAEREEQAILAAERLQVTWKPSTPLPDLGELGTALLAAPSTRRVLLDKGDVDAALAATAIRMPRTYQWPYQMHATLGPSCSVADWRPDGLTVWSGTQNPHWLRDDLALLMDLPPDRIMVHRLEAAGCYGRTCMDDVGADAALLSRAVGRPVRVQLSREQEHGWEPKGAAQVMQVDGGLDADGAVAAYDFATWYPSNRAATLALLLTGTISNAPTVSDMGDRTAVPPYAYAPIRVVVNDMAPIVRAAWLRGVSALPNTFAHESYVDELAMAAGIDPVEFRLRYLQDPRAIDVLKQTVEQAGWEPRTAPRMRRDADGILHGQGVAYALYVHSTFPGFGAAWSAWVTDVAVDPRSGEVVVERVVAGQDCGLMVNPDGVRHQLHGNVVQSISRVLKEQVRFDTHAVASREWGAYPILTFPELPKTQAVLLQRDHEPPMGAGESASVPSAAAIANAIFDATGVRFREVPFTPDRIRAGLAAAGMLTAPEPAQPCTPVKSPRRRGWRPALAGAFTALAGMGLGLALWPGAIDPVAPADGSLYSAATIARGRQLAALGNCAVCHTAAEGASYAGGYRIDTPFGTLVTPNITPDVATGIGGWSYAAFERAMRQGIARDGSHLYPAFPYTAFTRMSDGDLQALYAFLMSQPQVAAPRQAHALTFPFTIRPLLAGWNALFLRPGVAQVDPAKSEAWNRGAYLVNGVAHCGACHTPRNALGAERGAGSTFAGGVSQEWEAPGLGEFARSPLPWTEQDFFDYLRTGASRFHGVAAGPMGPVVRQLSQVPDADIRAMAVYLASLAPADAAAQPARAAELEARTALQATRGDLGAQLYDGACAMCHQPGRGPLLAGARPSLALNTAVHASAPDTLVRVILDGIAAPARPELGAMPGFAASLDDRQVTALVTFIRAQFAPGRPAWTAVGDTVSRLRAAGARTAPPG